VRDLLIACLSSVQEAIASAGLACEIWVVDNASQDGSLDAVRERFGSAADGSTGTRLRLIASPVNLLFGGGQNLALRLMGFEGVSLSEAGEAVARDHASVSGEGGRARARPRFVLILNPDTSVRPDALGKLVGFAAAHPCVGVCGPRLVYGDGRFQHAAYRFPSLSQCVLDFWPLNWRLTESRLNGRYPRQLYESGQPFAIDHPLGAAMLFRREVVEQTGGFDLEYRMYVEEIDWCMRVKCAGWKVFCVPSAEIVHYEGQSTRQVRPQMVVALWRSRFLLFERYYPRVFRWAARRVVRAGMRALVKRALANRAPMSETEAADVQSLVDAYRQVIALAGGQTGLDPTNSQSSRGGR
jgi:GT2 family glycosyltransferase